MSEYELPPQPTLLGVRVARASDREPVTELTLPRSATVADLVAVVRDCADFTEVEPSVHRRTIARLFLATPPPLPLAEITQSDYEWGSTLLTSVGFGDGGTVHAHFCASAEEAATVNGANNLHAVRVVAEAACDTTRRLAGILLVANEEVVARAAIVAEEAELVPSADALIGGLISAGASDRLAVRCDDFAADGPLTYSRPLTITNNGEEGKWVALPNIRVMPGQFCAVEADVLFTVWQMMVAPVPAWRSTEPIRGFPLLARLP